MTYSRAHMFSSLLGGILFCFVTLTTITWSSPIIPKLTNPKTSPFGRAIDVEEASWISSILLLGALLGVNIFGYLTDKIGRKLTLLIAIVPYVISNLIIAFATSVQLYYLARFLMGLTLGILFVIPMYIGEITHKSNRGVLGSLLNCASCSGSLFSNALGPFVSVKTFSLTLATISVLSMIIFALFAEEVPQYYIIKNKDAEARNALEILRGGYEDIDEAFEEIQNKYFEEKKGKLRDIFNSKALKKAFVMCTVLMIFQQFSGIVAILFYGQIFFQSGSFALSPEVSVIVLGIVQFLSSFLTPPLCARFGKRCLLCISGMGMFLSESVLAVYSYYDKAITYPKDLDILPILCLTLFIISYNIGFGPLPLLIVGESFPTRVKAVITSLVGIIIIVCIFVMTKYFMLMVAIIGLDGYFALSAACCFLATVFVKFYVIETKDKSLEEIQRELSK